MTGQIAKMSFSRPLLSVTYWPSTTSDERHGGSLQSWRLPTWLVMDLTLGILPLYRGLGTVNMT
jgi:hypothetical protein